MVLCTLKRWTISGFMVHFKDQWNKEAGPAKVPWFLVCCNFSFDHENPPTKIVFCSFFARQWDGYNKEDG